MIIVKNLWTFCILLLAFWTPAWTLKTLRSPKNISLGSKPTGQPLFYINHVRLWLLHVSLTCMCNTETEIFLSPSLPPSFPPSLPSFLPPFLSFYFWLCWVIVAVRGLSLVAASGATLRCSAWASHCGGFSCCRAQALGTQASVVVACGISSCGLWGLERRLSSCGAWA